MPVLSEVLRKRQNANNISTGNDDLNLALALAHTQSPSVSAGVPINTFTEISGPPGAGKAAILLGLILDTLSKGLTVLYVGCNSVPFPYHRARQLDGWNFLRFKDRLKDVYPCSIEQLLLIDQFFDISSFGLVVFSHYDDLVKPTWNRESRERIFPALLEKICSLRELSTVLATAGAIKFNNEENVSVLAPATMEAKALSNGVRLMVFRDTKGNCMLSTGEKFRVARSGIVPATEPRGDPLPLHVLSPKLWHTPSRPPLSQPLTPTGTQRKRRLSVSTPSRQSNIEADQQQPFSLGPATTPLRYCDPIHDPAAMDLSQYSSVEHGDARIPIRQGTASPLSGALSVRASDTPAQAVQFSPTPNTRAPKHSIVAENDVRFHDSQVLPNSQIDPHG